ncbi:MAG TPA: hypothetical protein VGR27_07280 [Longimicrobiaceae bacterium]|nr:hypothetical protein [Longimicrobiaceae bacterium]
MRPAVKLALATAAYGIVHSMLASRAAKRVGARAFGERNQRAFYRPFYIVQAVLTTGALLLYARQLPARTIYRVRGPAAWLLRAGQSAALLHAVAAAREVGLARISGLESVLAHLHGREVPVAPVAQGPELDPRRGSLTSGGPFRWSRHPLNFSPIPIFWLAPHLTTRRLAFNVVATLYLILGSVHEEVRLREAYGAKYRAYEKSGVPFFFPGVDAIAASAA